MERHVVKFLFSVQFWGNPDVYHVFWLLERNQNGAINLKVHFHIKENRLRSFSDSDRSNEAIYFHDRANPRSRTADGRCVRKLKRKTFPLMVLSLSKRSFTCISCSGFRPCKGSFRHLAKVHIRGRLWVYRFAKDSWVETNFISKLNYNSHLDWK